MKHTFLTALAFLMIVTSLGVAQVGRPNFSGHWELDKARSDFGSLPAEDSATDLIDHLEPRLSITQIWKNAEGEHTLVWQLTTDGAENINRTGGVEIRSRTGWEDSKLVTEWRMKREGKLIEGKTVRFLSEDGRIQTIHVHQRFSGGETKQILSMLKKSP